ncbi:hypothetical protein RRG08_023445 [Elysia crispata]|uniref:Uncharacterized protein n=1 Tax=Elysia crispata TaxID=231223 RepID=A0AAE1ADW1_9GAST|nr:hypothetical protein RRG08_023445 [Elysia crispata]
MGIWQIAAASNVLSCNILSVYPEKGASSYRQFFTRKITPRGQAVEPTVALMWSATKEHSLRMSGENWTANHVVPLMGLTQFCQLDIDR